MSTSKITYTMFVRNGEGIDEIVARGVTPERSGLIDAPDRPLLVDVSGNDLRGAHRVCDCPAMKRRAIDIAMGSLTPIATGR